MTLARLRARARDWVFDLDNTLYPAEATMYDALGARMTNYIARATGLDPHAALMLQERYFLEYGATVVGLVRHHGVDAHDFLTYVHDVEADLVSPDPDLRALIEALPGRKVVFTNGGGGHAERMVAQIGLDGVFDQLVDIESVGLQPKPQRAAYEILIKQCRIEPARAVLIEDTMRNLAPAHDLGFITVLIGHVHPDPRPAYVDHWAPDLKAFLREWLAIA